MQHYQRIRDLREDHDFTQDELCKKLYMHKTTYTNYEQGKHGVPLDFAVTLADFYDVSIDYIAGRTNHCSGIGGEDLAEDEIRLLKFYEKLNERNKGKLDLFIEQLLRSQEKK